MCVCVQITYRTSHITPNPGPKPYFVPMTLISPLPLALTLTLTLPRWLEATAP